MQGSDLWQRRASVLVTALCVALIVYLGFKYALGVILPFALAYLFSLAVRPAARAISRVTKIPYKPVAVVCMLLLFGAVVYILALIFNRALAELRNFFEALSDEQSELRIFINEAVDFISNLSEHLPISHRLKDQLGDGLGEKIDTFVLDTVNAYLSSLGSRIPSLVASILLSLPEILVFLTVMILSSFYFCFDTGQIGAFFMRILPQKWQARATAFKKKLALSLTGYFRAYAILFILTLGEIFIGLSILRVKYSFILSLIIASIDILPVLGVGSVLIPWAAIEFISRNARMGLSLVVLYAAVLIIRQIVEPKLVSKSIGIHPLAAVVSIYAGLRLIGIFGMIIGPFAALLVKSFLENRDENRGCV